MPDDRLLTVLPLAAALTLASLGESSAFGGPDREANVEIRFVDSATGAAIEPERLEAATRVSGLSKRLGREHVTRGRANLPLAPGQHTVTAVAQGYRPMSGEVEAVPGNSYRVVFHLDPLEMPQEITPEHLATLHRLNETLFVGYVVAEDTGRPMVGVHVASEPSGRQTTTDERGYFQLYVPVQTRAEALESPARLRFVQPGYRTVEHQYLELWSEGDWVYRIQLKRGGGQVIVDERQLRRRADYPLMTLEPESAAAEAARQVMPPASAENAVPMAGDPVLAGSESSPLLRIPTNIRVLRQDGVTIDYVSLQTYCQRSLPSEWIASWGSIGPGNSGTNSLNAGAVAIRTYAIGFINNPASANYDICGTTVCQVYNPMVTDSRTTAAVNFTANYVMRQPGATRIGFKLTEYSAENNSLGFACGDGYTQPTGGCIYDPVCAGEARFGHGRGMCQWGTARWSTGRRMQNRTTGDAVTNNFPLQNWVWLCEHYFPNLELVQGSPLMINDYVQVQGTGSLSVRRCADGSISGGTACPQITTKPSGANGLIIGGPVRITSDGVGYTWWQVRWFDANATVGWSAENWLERVAQPPTVPPVLAPIPDVALHAGMLLTFTNSATAPAEAIAVITDFEGFANGTSSGTVLFRAPQFSGSTSGFLDATPNLTSVTGTFPSGNDSSRALRANWSWNSLANPWLRLTTFNTANIPNPVIAINRTLRFDIHTDRALKVALGVRETTTPEGTPIGSDGGTTGAIEYVGVNPGSGAPDPVRTVTAGSWTTLEFNLPMEPVRSFSGGNGVLFTASGLGALEHIALVPAAGSGAYNVYLDNFMVAAPNTLTYSLSNAPPGATIHPATGVFSWTPSVAQGPGVYSITVEVTDNNLPPLRDSRTFQVTVVPAPSITGTLQSDGTFVLGWPAMPGATYRVQFKDALTWPSWSNATPDLVAGGPFLAFTNAPGLQQRFFRVQPLQP